MNGTEKAFLNRNKLGAGYLSHANKWFLPIIEKLQPVLTNSKRPLILGISGSQGSGKSLLADYLCTVVASRFNLNALPTSIDDFYHTKHERYQLGQDIHPLLATRGVPGTHDIDLAINVLDGLIEGSEDVLVPRFDKIIDDRCRVNSFTRVSNTLDLIVMEGWCLGANAQTMDKLQIDINKLERDFDPKFIWREYVNDCLAGPYQKLFDYVESLPTPSEPEQPSRRFCHLVMSDHVYDAAFVAQVQEYLNAGNYPSTLFVDPHIQQIFDLDDATKVLHEEGKLQELGKTLTHYNALDTGWFILDAQMLDISSALAKHQRQFGVSSVIDAYQKHLRFHCESIDQGRWQDVDNPAMFEAATKLFS